MKIRAKFTVLFSVVVIVVLTIVSLSIYYASYRFRQDDFQRRLRNRAINAAKVLAEVKEVNAELLKRIERNNPASLPDQRISIYDDHFQQLYASDENPAAIINFEILKNLKEIPSQIATYVDHHDVLYFSLAEATSNLYIIASAVDLYGNDALRNLRNILLVVFCGSVVLVCLLGWIYSGRVLQPISRIVTEVGSINESNLNSRVAVGPNGDELDKLAETFNSMLTRLQGAFGLQKNFISNASHEIKTPITVMSGEIEVALLQKRDSEYYLQVLQSVLTSLKGLNALSTQLLLLAQASAEHSKTNFQLIRIDDLLWEAKEDLVKAFPDYKIEIDFDLNIIPESLTIRGDEQLMRVAFLNLMDNGCKYANNKNVTVRLRSMEGGAVEIRFLNEGQTISAENIGKIFEPFFREKKGTTGKGFGIGLSLVSSVVKLHKGSTEVKSENGQTIFTLRFNSASISSFVS
jgi:signal transduction histidine kinase